MCVCMYVYTYVIMYECMYVYMYVCVCVYVHVFMYECMYIYIYITFANKSLSNNNCTHPSHIPHITVNCRLTQIVQCLKRG